MTCNVCGYTGNNFDPNGMGRLCCPSCGAEQPEMAGSMPPSQGLEEYAAMLKQLAGATYTLQPSEDFSRLDAFGTKNAAFLNQFSPDTLYRALWGASKYCARPQEWSDELWRREVQSRVCTEGSQSESFLLPTFEGRDLLGFEVIYAAGSVLEFRVKYRKGIMDSHDGHWHSYFTTCRFIDGDVRPLMDGQKMKSSFLLQTQKTYRYSK